jgi:hypothetical protein
MGEENGNNESKKSKRLIDTYWDSFVYKGPKETPNTKKIGVGVLECNKQVALLTRTFGYKTLMFHLRGMK